MRSSYPISQEKQNLFNYIDHHTIIANINHCHPTRPLTRPAALSAVRSGRQPRPSWTGSLGERQREPWRL